MNSRLQKIIVGFHTEEAYDFYRNFIYNEAHQGLLIEHGFKTAGSIAPVNWELFGSILTGDNHKQGYGSDLHHFEIKSAVANNGFEYQYHLHGGKTKLQDDMKVNHIFISYSKDYRDISVRIVEGPVLEPLFESWIPGLIENYEGTNRRQRYRKNVPFGMVAKNGVIVLQTRDGILIP